MTDKDLHIVNLLSELYQGGSIWFILGSFISADLADSSKPHVLEIMKEFQAHLDDTDIPKSDKSKIQRYIDDGIELLTAEVNKLQ